MGLFPELERSGEREEPTHPDAPLAERMRPSSLDEVAGLDDVAGIGGFLRKALAEERVPSLIFWGPPGCGKTTLARLVARGSAARYVAFSAVVSGIKEVKAIMEEASQQRRRGGTRTLLFVDEIHRFNRAQQDAFLPYVERGDIILIGATTENPSFEINGALLSRLRVVVIPAVGDDAMDVILDRALADGERGLGQRRLSLAPDARSHVRAFASGDARRALSLLEAAAADAPDGATLTLEALQEASQRRILLYDKAGEEHFNLISALHKSMRNSDANATLYWLARMLESGEAPLYVARRIVRFASEDVGLADPQALVQAIAAKEAVDFIGMPEGALALAQAALYCAMAPKSNALTRGYGAAATCVREHPADPVPLAIRNAVTPLMKGVGYGGGYRYAHDTEEGIADLDCLPERLKGRAFYEPVERGFEREVKKRLAWFASVRERGREGGPDR